MGEKNIRVEFRAAKFVSYDPKTVISRLDFKFRISTLLDFRLTSAGSINPNTPKTTKNIVQNFTKLKYRIARHQSSSFI